MSVPMPCAFVVVPPELGRRTVVFSVVNPDGSAHHVETQISDFEFHDLAGPEAYTYKRIVRPALSNLVARAEQR